MNLSQLAERMAAELYKKADYSLWCDKCGNSFLLMESRAAQFFATGWPSCCGVTMNLKTEKRKKARRKARRRP